MENLTADYHGYYSGRLQRCLMLVEESASSKRRLERVSFVVDITEQREYAYYLADNNEVVICELKPAINHETFCKTRNEFDGFIADGRMTPGGSISGLHCSKRLDRNPND